MKKIIRAIAGFTGGITFALSPLILMITYFTYTEKIILPIVMLIMVVCGLIIVFTEEEI